MGVHPFLPAHYYLGVDKPKSSVGDKVTIVGVVKDSVVLPVEPPVVSAILFGDTSRGRDKKTTIGITIKCPTTAIGSALSGSLLSVCYSGTKEFVYAMAPVLSVSSTVQSVSFSCL